LKLNYQSGQNVMLFVEHAYERHQLIQGAMSVNINIQRKIHGLRFGRTSRDHQTLAKRHTMAQQQVRESDTQHLFVRVGMAGRKRVYGLVSYFPLISHSSVVDQLPPSIDPADIEQLFSKLVNINEIYLAGPTITGQS
jgi:hypothetical protein